MEENNQSQNQPQPQNQPQTLENQNDAPFMLPIDHTELYHQLAPSAPINNQIQKQESGESGVEDIYGAALQANEYNFDPALVEKESEQITPISEIEEKFPSYKDAVFHIEVDKIKPNPFQPRRIFNDESLRELAASIREFGVLQPIVVTKIEKEVETGTQVEYQLIAGERRLMASKIAGLERIPTIIKRVASDDVKMEMAIVENLQRANLNSVETARAYAKLQDQFGLTQREIAAKLGKSRETISNSIRLLNLPSEIQDALAEGKINESQGRLLLTIEDLNQQMAIFRDLMFNNLSVRELKNRIRRENNQQSTPPILEQADNDKKQIDPELNAMQEQLMELLGAPVKIEQIGEKGKIVIQFFSPEEIKGIIQKLANKY